ncbi:protein shisa-5-like isoform X2 [Saccostrea cucullata]|uniref:protein shisa-5-like isoform X2 n=1 Tax=Saccostrea cuccullata TaxID=36930 RepID=UPI002ED5F7C8
MSQVSKIWVFFLSLFNILGYHFASAAYYCNYYYSYCYYYYYYYYYYSSYSSAGTIAGAVVGSIVFLVIVAVVIIIICCKKKNRPGMIIQNTPAVHTVTTAHYGQPGYGQPPPSYGQPQPGFNQYNQYPPPGGNPAYPPPQY